MLITTFAEAVRRSIVRIVIRTDPLSPVRAKDVVAIATAELSFAQTMPRSTRRSVVVNTGAPTTTGRRTVSRKRSSDTPCGEMTHKATTRPLGLLTATLTPSIGSDSV